MFTELDKMVPNTILEIRILVIAITTVREQLLY